MTIKIDSAKTVEVAELPKKKFGLVLNLQTFAGEIDDADVDLDADDDIHDDEHVDDSEHDEVNEEIDEQEPGANDSDLANQKPVQDEETRAQFAEMRRQAEQAEARARYADEVIARQYGESHGIYTVEQYEQALFEQQQEEQRQQYLERGIDPDEISQIVNQQLENHPLVQQAAQQTLNHLYASNYAELQSEYGDLVKTPEDIPVEVWDRWGEGRFGLSLTEAFTLVNRKEIMNKQALVAKQTALNNINNKGHIRGNGGANGDIETVEIPDDVYKMYKQLNPKATDKQIRAHYKKSIKG